MCDVVKGTENSKINDLSEHSHSNVGVITLLNEMGGCRHIYRYCALVTFGVTINSEKLSANVSSFSFAICSSFPFS